MDGLELGRCANTTELPAVASMASNLGRRRARAASAEQIMAQGPEPLLHACRRLAAVLHSDALPEADRRCGRIASLAPVVANMQRLRLRSQQLRSGHGPFPLPFCGKPEGAH